ncbi:hypothetical protein J6590_102066, partial [Homalodisca vitripennis]
LSSAGIVHIDQSQPLVACVSLLIYLCHAGENLVYLKLSFSLENSANLYFQICDIYVNLLKCSQFFGCLLLMCKCASIQNTVMEEVGKLKAKVIEERSSLGRFRNSNIRIAWGEDTNTWLDQLSFLYRIHGNLSHENRSVWCCYRVFVFWITTVAAVWTPFYLVQLQIIPSNTWMKYWSLRPSLCSYPILIVMVITCLTMYQSTQANFIKQLSLILVNSRRKKQRKVVKSQLLAGHHRSSSVSCYLFDVSVSLLVSVLDTIERVHFPVVRITRNDTHFLSRLPIPASHSLRHVWQQPSLLYFSPELQTSQSASISSQLNWVNKYTILNDDSEVFVVFRGKGFGCNVLQGGMCHVLRRDATCYKEGSNTL